MIKNTADKWLIIGIELEYGIYTYSYLFAVIGSKATKKTTNSITSKLIITATGYDLQLM